ncbi:2Fe-2S iron-sulfur cluster binding domain-containing protein [Mesorhizobium sp. M8A.F.Ca.ET.218.01.1.1]|uniref:2Fe-2S iron-sulfur cluster-binding protein n=1 Tax=unclassified Mesorhizobium TaxID=325217 RepID=UPI0032AFF2E9
MKLDPQDSLPGIHAAGLRSAQSFPLGESRGPVLLLAGGTGPLRSWQWHGRWSGRADATNSTTSRAAARSRPSCRSTALAALRGTGLLLMASCEKGVCGTCECGMLEGQPIHRDAFLSRQAATVGLSRACLARKVCSSSIDRQGERFGLQWHRRPNAT